MAFALSVRRHHQSVSQSVTIGICLGHCVFWLAQVIHTHVSVRLVGFVVFTMLSLASRGQFSE